MEILRKLFGAGGDSELDRLAKEVTERAHAEAAQKKQHGTTCLVLDGFMTPALWFDRRPANPRESPVSIRPRCDSSRVQHPLLKALNASIGIFPTDEVRKVHNRL